MGRLSGLGGATVGTQRDAWWIALLCALGFYALHHGFVTRAQPDALYMDSLRLLYQVHAWEQGRMSLAELWGAGSAHRGLINPLILLANVHLFSLDVLLVNRLTGVAVAVAVFSLLLVFNSYWNRNELSVWAIRISASVLIAALCFSWAGFELFTLDLGFPLWIKNTCFILFYAFHARYVSAETMTASRKAQTSAALAATGALIVIFVGMGWSYAFVGAIVVVQGLSACVDIIARRRSLVDLAMRFVPLLCMLLALIWSLTQGAADGKVEDDASFARLAGSIPELSGLVLYALGGGWMGAETLGDYGFSIETAFWAGLLGLLVGGWLLVDRCRRGLYSGSLLPLYLLGYGALTALSLGVARGEAGAHAVLASRYYMDIVLFLVGILWLAAESAAARRGGYAQAVSVVLYCVLASSLVVGAGLNGKREWTVAPYRAQAFEAMNAALAHGVPDEAAARLLQSPIEHARLGAVVLRDERLALFATAPAGEQACDPVNIERAGDWNMEEPGGRWMGESAQLTVPFLCECDLAADLFIPQGFQSRVLKIGEGEGSRQVALEPERSVRIEIPAHESGREIAFVVSATTRPSETIQGSIDVRRLGVFWSGVAFACQPEQSAP